MLALGFNGVHVFDQQNYPEFPIEYKQTNLLFRPQRSGISGFKTKVLSRYYSFLRKIPSGKARFQSLGFGADQYCLSKRGFCGPLGSFQKLSSINLDPDVKNETLRDDYEIFEICSWVLDGGCDFWFF